MLRAWLVFGVMVTTAEAVQSWSERDLSDPKLAPCGQGRRICDPEGYLRTGIDAIEKALHALETDYEYPGCGGYEMGVVVVGHIRGKYETGTAASTAAFAKAIMDSWGVGKAACNNGILLAIAIEDRKMFIATGRGAKEYIPDNELASVVERMKPLMRNVDYVGATEQCVSDIARILSGESFVPSKLPALGFFGLVFGFISLSACHSRSQTQKYNECKRKLMEIERQRSQARARQYQQTSCAICLELFEDTPRKQNELLVCGHQFHKDCLSSWEDRSGTCPICRQPTTEPLGTVQVAGQASQPFTRRQSADADWFSEDEYRFRLRRAHHYYPRYVTNDMVSRWTSSDFQGQIVADKAFIRSSPNYSTPQSGRSGGGGSSFGGGCSSGGGGAGGGW